MTETGTRNTHLRGILIDRRHDGLGEHPEHLTRRHGHRDHEPEIAAPDLGIDDQAIDALVRHGAEPPRSQRSRSETSTTTDTSSSTRLSAIAASGSFSSA